MSYDKVANNQSKLIIGVKQTLKAIQNGEISEVFVADDAEQHITQKVAKTAHTLDIPCLRVDSKEKLGKACGIDVDASTVAIKK